MKIRNLLVLAITIAFGTLSAPAQERDGSVTFKDHSNQSISISRFGTVLSFRNLDGKEIVPGNAYSVCPCGEKGPCIESATAPSEEAKSKLEVESPKRGTTLKRGQTLVVTASFDQGALTVKRRLTWIAGSSMVKVDETIAALKALCVSTYELRSSSLTMKMCPRPPGAAARLPHPLVPEPRAQITNYLICPPESEAERLGLTRIRTNYDFSKL